MKLESTGLLLRIYLGESDQWHGKRSSPTAPEADGVMPGRSGAAAKFQPQ